MALREAQKNCSNWSNSKQLACLTVIISVQVATVERQPGLLLINLQVSNILVPEVIFL